MTETRHGHICTDVLYDCVQIVCLLEDELYQLQKSIYMKRYSVRPSVCHVLFFPSIRPLPWKVLSLMYIMGILYVKTHLDSSREPPMSS